MRVGSMVRPQLGLMIRGRGDRPMTLLIRAALVTALLSFGVAGTWLRAQNTFGTPKTIIHVSLIQWKEGVPDADKQRVLEGVKDMAAKIPGIRNVWTKALRVQPQGYHDAFVIEFENETDKRKKKREDESRR